MSSVSRFVIFGMHPRSIIPDPYRAIIPPGHIQGRFLWYSSLPADVGRSLPVFHTVHFVLSCSHGFYTRGTADSRHKAVIDLSKNFSTE